MVIEKPARHRRMFVVLALTTVFFTVGLIVFGAVVRVTDSGLGCNRDWPLCGGTIFPPLDNLTAWIEWTHRLLAMLIGVLGVGMLVFAFRAFRRQNRAVLYGTLVAAGLFAVQSFLGALVVMLDLPPTMVTVHLGTAMLLLAALLFTYVGATYKPAAQYAHDHVSTLLYATTGVSLIIILTGALVRGSGATLACIDWPLCNGSALPFDQGPLQTVHMTHRFAVLAFGVLLGVMIWYAYRSNRPTLVKRTTVAAFVLYLMQSAVGALFVLTAAAPIWGTLHVGLAAMTWAALAVGSFVEAAHSGTLKFGYVSEA
ncbi:MAG: COX15/CtaA family protein [Anaerolineae bacterium]|nr:COX15/CtaA family protein [Anaerolineae bacterium]